MNEALRNYKPIDRLLYFIRAREAARMQKELVGGPPPYSPDPIIAQYRFCNVNREHDNVTKWIKTSVRDKYQSYGKNVLVPIVLAARILNEPETLAGIDLLDLPNSLVHLRELRAQGRRLLRGAYMMPVHGSAGMGKLVVDYYIGAAIQAQSVDWTKCESLEGVAELLMRLEGIGSFLANQVCADLRYTQHWAEASDWGTFVMCGAGSGRGIDRYDLAQHKIGTKKQEYYQGRIPHIRNDIIDLVSPEVGQAFLDINNVSNTLCEFDKFERALWADKPFSLRQYVSAK